MSMDNEQGTNEVIDGQETAAETHAHDGNRQLSIFHKITPFML